jgi:hypothetical protein
MHHSLESILKTYLCDPEAGWSMGSFGAIAEFHQEPDELGVIDAPDQLTRATSRGGIRLTLQEKDRVKPVAYETPSKKRHRWSHGIALCVASSIARQNTRRVLTPLGPDTEALRSQDRESMLFDMGLGLSHCDFCVRTADRQLITILQDNAGRSIFHPDNPAMALILARHPHRIAITPIGRVEVYQKIGGPDTGGVSPAGPHTHVLPKLLKAGQTHAANIAIPDGLAPCGYLHPGNPVIHPLGGERSFDVRLHEAFQALFNLYGPENLVRTKNSVIDAIWRGEGPGWDARDLDRFERSTVRVAVRQANHLLRGRENAALAQAVDEWRAMFDATVTNSADDSEPSDDEH